jgi:pimeloyl-ACP methyl ester carboxylesterase
MPKANNQYGPLILRERGTFYVGGERVHQSEVDVGRPGIDGHVFVNQMYVEYMVPQSAAPKVPVVMVHGTSLSGKTFDTTPDGRMGWFEYFVRNGHPVYVVDQVSRGRSGFDQAPFNQVRVGTKPPGAQANIKRFNEELAWTVFRFGPSFGTSFPDTRFPVKAATELARQNIPDLNATLPSPAPNWRALAELASRLGGAVLMSHSQSGAFPLDAALIAPGSVRGVVLVEPGSQGCKAAEYTENQIAKLAGIPTLVVYGDHLDADTGLSNAPRLWRNSCNDCMRFVERVNAIGGRATMLELPASGIRGNSHMLMQDTNNIEVANMILKWIDESVSMQ